MRTLDVETLLGSRICKGLCVTSVLMFDRFVVLGTDAGCVMGFSTIGEEEEDSASEAAGVCLYAQTLHYGAVHSLAVSTSHLIASAGHDASPVVQPVINLLKNGSVGVGRLRGHTLPVTAMTFFSTGSWLATCGVGGRFIVFDVVARSCICDVGVGFSLCCLALAPDETSCFVGGTRICRIDLYNRDRPLDPLKRRDSLTPWLQQYLWCSCDGGEDPVADSPPDLFIASIDVSADTVAAIFRSRGNRKKGGAISTWSEGVADFWISRNFRRVAAGALRADAPLHRPSFRRIVVEEVREKERAPLVLRACDGWDSWRRARVFVGCAPPVQRLSSAALALEDAVPPRAGDETLEERHAREEERGRLLQAECDELVHHLKSLVKLGGRKRPRKRAAVSEGEG